MLRESDFINRLRDLLSLRVRGVDEERKREIIERLAGHIRSAGDTAPLPECRWVPFTTGRRPIDEASYPGLGSSDHVALILDGEASRGNTAYLLFRVDNLEQSAD